MGGGGNEANICNPFYFFNDVFLCVIRYSTKYMEGLTFINQELIK